MELWDCRHLLFFYAFVDIAIRFFDTDHSLPMRFSVIAVKQKEVVTLTSVRYSCKTSKTSKTRTCYDPVSHINNWKKLTPDGGKRLQRINTGWENHHPSKTPFNGCKYIILTHMWTAVEEIIIKAILAVMNTTQLIVKIRPEKNSGPKGIWTHHLCDTGVAFYKLSWSLCWF